MISKLSEIAASLVRDNRKEAIRGRDGIRGSSGMISMLCEKVPHAFFIFEQRRRPLALGIHKEIAAAMPTLTKAWFSNNRLSRYNETGLVWLLQGRDVVALTEATASINGTTGNITIYRKHNKPGARAGGRQPFDHFDSPFGGSAA